MGMHVENHGNIYTWDLAATTVTYCMAGRIPMSPHVQVRLVVMKYPNFEVAPKIERNAGRKGESPFFFAHPGPWPSPLLCDSFSSAAP